MVFPTIMPANSVSGFNITNSVRFNKADNPQLNLANVGTVTNDKKFTYSVWLKRGIVDTSPNYSILSAVSGNNKAQILFRGGSSNAIRFIETANNFTSTDSILTTAALFRDPSAWYHIVVAYDSTDGTAGNRVKIYANGVLQTLSGTTVNENYTTPFNEASYNLDVGHFDGASGEVYDGYMSEANFIDGQQLAPTAFGETDDNGVWIPIKYTGTYGNNGFFLEFKQTGTGTNASGIGADTSGNDRHFAPTNLAATDVTTDTPTNNFMTLNSALADGQFNTSELSEGNTFYNSDEGNDGAGQPTGTFPVTSGKWYWEVKVPSAQNSRSIGIVNMDRVSIDQPPQLHGTGFTATNSTVSVNFQDLTADQVDKAGTHTQEQASLASFANNDIYGIYLNMDDGNIRFYKNGSAYTNQFDLDDLADWQSGGAVPTASGAAYQAYLFNFGNPAFAISSGNADGRGYGNFEYAVPSGYYSICTKNLAEFG